MLSRLACAFWALALVPVLALSATSQSVVSTHSGIIHYFEGAIYLGDQPLELHPGKFSNVPPGAELRTTEGRAEVLLTPGVFLRIGERSSIRMIANELSDTRVELVAGTAIVDSAEPVPGTSVTLIYQNWKVHFLEQGLYRIDSNPPRMWVREGKAEVSGNNAKALLVEEGACLPFAQVLVPDRTINPPLDALNRWADGRQQSIAADNAIAANIQDPATIDTSGNSAPSVGGFTYFPPLWLPPPGLSLSSLYGSQDPYQPGFSSVYLPGYSYLPLFFGIARIGSPPVRLPHSPSGHVLPPIRIPIPVHTVSVLPTPVLPVHVMPAPVHPISSPPASVHTPPAAGVHLGAHR
jgi:hypothetical protein